MGGKVNVHLRAMNTPRRVGFRSVRRRIAVSRVHGTVFNKRQQQRSARDGPGPRETEGAVVNPSFVSDHCRIARMYFTKTLHNNVGEVRDEEH